MTISSRDKIRRGERWLVLGASGWVGRTLLSMSVGRAKVLAVGGRSGTFHEWSQECVASFEPTHVFSCAFLTKEKLATHGYDEYVRTNRMLIERFSFAANLPSCETAVVISSGSVIHDPMHPYSELKLLEEAACREVISDGRAGVILRAFSMSGPYVSRVHDYAFSNIIAQALQGGLIRITASHEVWRRYVSVEQAMEVCLRIAKRGVLRIVETGGPLVEVGELAAHASLLLGGTYREERNLAGHPDRYLSDNSSWELACLEAGVASLTLTRQINLALAGCKLTALT